MNDPVCYLVSYHFIKRREAFPWKKHPQRSKTDIAAKAYDRINLIVKKGQKEVIQAHGAKANESVNGFINRAIEEAMQRDDEKES